MTLNQILDYLRRDLKQSVIDDVGPCVRPNASVGGYFAVPRLVLTYVDYMGALYHGYASRRKGRRRKFADKAYAKAFLRDVFGVIDVNYHTYGSLLWQIYRNGTIHLYQPMALENRGKTISWLTYKGPRAGHVRTQVGNVVLTHLVPCQYSTTGWWQPISIVCLYEDLLNSIDEYARQISRTPSLEANFRQVADALQIPELTGETWW